MQLCAAVLILAAVLPFFPLQAAPAANVPVREVQYLSGTDKDHTVTWDFFCTDGRRSGSWQTIEVPSCWEQQGFGTYNYGRDYNTNGRRNRYAAEQGQYRYRFTVPSAWKDRRIVLVFEGSMTDTEVRLNGQSAGDIHRGSFYRFTYDVTDKIVAGGENLLEVTVDKWSSDASVNNAERLSDYWIFGGIYRPVYLEAYPAQHLSQVALNARADGTFALEAQVEQLAVDATLQVDILDVAGQTVHRAETAVARGTEQISFKTKMDGPLLWTAETPNLYTARLTLRSGRKTLYATTQKFGFRTIEVRRGDGIYLNGVKVKMKGVNRHCFWPETGRTTSKAIDIMDVNLLKDMNMNAVRCSHYPPDQSFLDVCDSLGIYVIDELAGWQNAYSTEAGTPLVREMVLRDVTHPSVIFWSNGNEGGTNKELDDDFLLYDPSRRPVIHAHHRPGNDFNGIDCDHYENYASIQNKFRDTLIYMPTEFLHAQNDGGGAAALYEYWEAMWAADRSGGGFLWAFADEDIVRTDRGNVLDADRISAPDGVVGPYREKEGSFFAIKEIYAPVHFFTDTLPAGFNGTFDIENRYHFLSLATCTYKWSLIDYRAPGDPAAGHLVASGGDGRFDDIAPVTRGTLRLPLPASWKNHDALKITVYDGTGREMLDKIWKIRDNAYFAAQTVSLTGAREVSCQETERELTLQAGGLSVSLSKTDGTISRIQTDGGQAIRFGGGPVLCTGEAVFTGFKHYATEAGYVVEAAYEGDLKRVVWTMLPSGWLQMDYTYHLDGEYNFAGITFDHSEWNIIGVKYLGNGPYRVWKNRWAGVGFDVWDKAYHPGQTGVPPVIYPEFSGYYADVAWMKFYTVQGQFTVVSQDDRMFFRLYDFYGYIGADRGYPDLPSGDISFLDAIPPVGAKTGTGVGGFGPSSGLNSLHGDFSHTLWFYFGYSE